ncbi:TonB C-terminal domain-containing protein [Nitratiruptor tergarcus]|uniref:TonB C terminal n=1 Tax=Nitratiruptor tergarcus DSM 16512 TaxID=1069081 RepID=A0A1W1WUD1_9BACT|nr:TonB C-terminal domain-containing protein [Nitratiruptor tergarcus]SMC09934.1 TonB C terminal [Nitratiruptor tergarcus DSM 16512]
MDKNLFKLIALIVTVILYGAVLFFFLDYFFEHEAPKKIAIKAQAIDVMIEEKRDTKKVVPIKKVAPKAAPKKKQAKGSPAPKSTPKIEDLFASLNTKKLAKKRATVHKRASTPSKYKGKSGKKAQKLLKKLKLQDIQLTSKKSIKSVSGEKDPYLEKLYKILYTYWMPSQLSAGNRAKVKIFIDRNGRFTYEVLQYGQNEIFNAELDDYLQRMQMQRFPLPDRPKEFIVYFEAKE